MLSVDNFSKDLIQTLLKISPKFVFNLCEEINGKCELEMCVAGLLELMGIPYTGSDPFALGPGAEQISRQADSAIGGHSHGARLSALSRAEACDSARHAVPHDRQACARGRQPWHQQRLRMPYGRSSSNGRFNTFTMFTNRRRWSKSISTEGSSMFRSWGTRNPEVLAISEIDFAGLPEDEPQNCELSRQMG